MVREAFDQTLHAGSTGIAGARPFAEPGSVDRDQRELGRNETGVGGYERESSEQPERGVDRSSRRAQGWVVRAILAPWRSRPACLA
jgi:hypothetical protein